MTQPLPTGSRTDKDLFFEALDLADVAERIAFLDRICAGDPEKRKRLEELLANHFKQDRFMEDVAAENAAFQLPANTFSEVSGMMIGRYKLLEKLGEGGFGAVYVAEQKEPVKRRVALKVIKLGMDTRQVVARFEAERQALAMMDHPNIAKVLDAGATDAGRPYFVMELVRGVRITQYCEENDLPIEHRLKLFIQVCQAIQHAHQKGIIHRDIKPSNILVTLHDGVPVPKVIDFGIAKAVEGDLTEKTIYTQYHQFLGTPAYMSPEQAEMSGLDIDTRTDVYALGVLLYELLTKTTPFDGKELLSAGIEEMRRTIREKDPARPSTRLKPQSASKTQTSLDSAKSEITNQKSKIDADLDWIVMKCLEKDRTRRYETAHGLAMDIQRHLQNEPIRARPPTTFYRLKKTWHRHRVLVSTVAVVAVILVAAVVVSTWQAVIATRARVEAVTARNVEKQEHVRAEAAKLAMERNLYIATMNLAQQAWEQNDLSRLRQFLNETRNSPYRGLEWQYWQTQSHRALKSLRGHIDDINSIAYSPDGQRIVSASDDHTAKIWDPATARELFTLAGHTGPIKSVAWSTDGRWIVTGSYDHTARVWDAAGGREVQSLKMGSARVWSVAISRDARQVATGQNDGTVRLWSLPEGRPLSKFWAHAGGVKWIDFSRDDTRIATAGGDNLAKIWDRSTLTELKTLKGHSDALSSIAFASDGARVITAADDSTARIWETASGRELFKLVPHAFNVKQAAFSPDGQRAATASQDGSVRIWNASTGQLLRTLHHKNDVWALAFSPDSRRIASAADLAISIWDVEGDGGITTTNGVNAVSFTSDGERFATGSSFPSRKALWESSTGRLLQSYNGLSSENANISLSSDGRLIAAGNGSREVALWDVSTGRQLRKFEGHTGLIHGIALSPDARMLLTGSEDGTFRLWETSTGRELMRRETEFNVFGVAFSPDGRRILTASGQAIAHLWDAATGERIGTLRGHEAAVLFVGFSNDGQRILTTSFDQTARMWDTATGRELLALRGHSAWVRSAAFSPDGQRILTASEDATAKMWDVATGRELLTVHAPGAVWSVAFSPTDRQIAVGGTLFTIASPSEISAWEADDQSALARVAERKREHAEALSQQRLARRGDEGAIKKWLLLAPISMVAGQNGTTALLHDFVEAESQLRPRSGDSVSIRGHQLAWKPLNQDDYILDFNAILGRNTPNSVVYGVCYIQSESTQPDLRILVGSDDQSKIYLNGEKIYASPMNRGFLEDEDVVENVRLTSGQNTLVFKVVNESSDWKGSIRLTDAAGKPVRGIKTTLEPVNRVEEGKQ